MKHSVKKIAQVGLICLSFNLYMLANEPSPAPPQNAGSDLTANHAQFTELKKAFNSGAEVTEACTSCHNLASEQFKKTIHWTWNSPENHSLGKGQNSMNNFCISTNKMHDRVCLNCHTAWEAEGVTGEVNCLNCHSGVLMNWSEAFSDIEGLEVDPDDEEAMMFAQEIRDTVSVSVSTIGPSSKENCGKCHFKGGGGEAVKHGDLDSSLLNASRELDVHMAKDGEDFTCTRCHTTNMHNITGRIYETPAVAEKKTLTEDDTISKIACISCHTKKPHIQPRLNYHTRTLSCQACHIPEVAKEEPTMVEWDWSTAGKRKDGRPYSEKSDFGKHFYSYKSIKGSFKWKKNLAPEYHWYNGTMKQLTFDDQFDPTKVVMVNEPQGTADDGNSKIHPFKTMRTNQPYDKVRNQLVAPLLSSKGGFWETLDWDSAIRMGMEIQGLEYSGELGFIRTEFSYSLNHMISPKENALQCVDCHKEQGLMENISGVYIPGKDQNPWIDSLGILSVVMAFIGALVHSLLRFVGQRKQKKQITEGA